MAVQRILHEADHLAIFPVKTELSVAAPTASGATYLQATQQTTVDAVNEIIAALVEAGILVED